MEKKFNATVSQWGLSLGIRIPREIVQSYNFEDKEEVEIILTKSGFYVSKPKIESGYDFVI
jgi:antitoxin component of MazEF toxin-antitoxin module